MKHFERAWAILSVFFFLAAGSDLMKKELRPSEESLEEVRLLENVAFNDGLLNSVCISGKKECVEGLFLHCSRGNSTSSSTNPEKCLCLDGMVGGANRTLPCTGKIGTPCKTEGAVELRKECISNGLCYDGICKCAPGFSSSPSKQRCHISMSGASGHRCNKIDDCDFYAGLSCVQGSCTCDSTYLIWDSKVKKCTAKIGSVCDEGGGVGSNPGTRSCVENGVCSSRKICTCSGDFLATASGECKAAYGMNCTIEGGVSTCHPNFVCLLHGPHGLVCSCHPKEVYHDAYAHCDRLAEEDCSNNSPCVPNSICFNERCVCLSGFEPNEAGRCVATHGGDCSRNPNVCSKRRRLVCNTKKQQCDCPTSYKYDDTLGECFGFPGAACRNTTDCHSLSECKESICECKSGWTRNTPDGLCQLTWNEECSVSHTCNPFDFLRCDFSTQHCVCETEDMVYNTERKSCEAKAKAVCFMKGLQGRQLSCRRNAQCVRQNTSHLLSQDYGTCECTTGFQSSDKGDCDENASTAPQTHQTSIFKIILCSIVLCVASLS